MKPISEKASSGMIHIDAHTDKDAQWIPRRRRVAAWMVHLFTASGALFGLLALDAIYWQQYVKALWMMAGAIFVDAVDGFFARHVGVKEAAPRIDGAMLDNIIDYANYVIIPAFFIIVVGILPDGWNFTGAGLVVLSSAYQFSQLDAKTDDHFFRGFPSYWNIAVIYLFLWQGSPWANLAVIFTLAGLVFVPIKYIYPSRMNYLSSKRWLRRGMLGATVVWGGCLIALLWTYPRTIPLLKGLCVAYIFLYLGVSLYRTFVPLEVRPEESPG